MPSSPKGTVAIYSAGIERKPRPYPGRDPISCPQAFDQPFCVGFAVGGY